MPYTTSQPDDTDRLLLDTVQLSIPLHSQPYQQLAQHLNTTETDVINRLINLKEHHHIIRRISPIFDTVALGYKSSLVAAHCDPANIDHAVSIINAHPGVTHNYQRDHHLNLWYTIALPPNSNLCIRQTISIIHAAANLHSTHLLPAIKLYKINARFLYNPQSARHIPSYSHTDRTTTMQFEITPHIKRIIRATPTDLPLIPQPFSTWAKSADCDITTLLKTLNTLLQQKQLRRLSAILNHRKIGFTANVMTLWNVDDTKADQFGQFLAQNEAISHCYLRPRLHNWPYNLYTMIHARSRNIALRIISSLQNTIQADNYLPLWTLKEHKKTRLAYFTDDIPTWEIQHTNTLPHTRLNSL